MITAEKANKRSAEARARKFERENYLLHMVFLVEKDILAAVEEGLTMIEMNIDSHELTPRLVNILRELGYTVQVHKPNDFIVGDIITLKIFWGN